MDTAIREGCGTFLGLKLHHANGEPPCSECLRREDLRRAEHEGIPHRLPPANDWPDITPIQASWNRYVLAEALRESDREHRRKT